MKFCWPHLDRCHTEKSSWFPNPSVPQVRASWKISFLTALFTHDFPRLGLPGRPSLLPAALWASLGFPRATAGHRFFCCLSEDLLGHIIGQIYKYPYLDSHKTKQKWEQNKNRKALGRKKKKGDQEIATVDSFGVSVCVCVCVCLFNIVKSILYVKFGVLFLA